MFFGGLPYPSFSRMMIFIDGENLVMRYQEMLKGKIEPNNLTQHKLDTYVWNGQTTQAIHQKGIGLFSVVRAIYYTYCQGTEVDLKNAIKEIKGLTFLGQMNQKVPIPYTHVSLKKLKEDKQKEWIFK